jgi:hypothetical protein
VLGDIIRRTTHRQLRDWHPPRTRPAAMTLGMLALGSGLFLLRRTRTE